MVNFSLWSSNVIDIVRLSSLPVSSKSLDQLSPTDVSFLSTRRLFPQRIIDLGLVPFLPSRPPTSLSEVTR